MYLFVHTGSTVQLPDTMYLDVLSGSREQDPQLQAFLQAQSGAYSWHPPQPAPKPQMQHLL